MDYLAKAEKAIEYLAQSEHEWAQYKALLKFQPERHKACLARLQSESLENTEAAKKRDAEADKQYQDIIDEGIEIAEHFYLLDAKRQRAEHTIEMYRSVNSALKRGNI